MCAYKRRKTTSEGFDGCDFDPEQLSRWMIVHNEAYIGLCFSSAKMALLASSPYLQRPIKTSFYEINYQSQLL